MTADRESEGAAKTVTSTAPTLGLDRLGLWALRAPWIALLIILLVSALALFSVTRIKVYDSLSELFRTDTKEFRQYEDIDKRFPSSEYDVLVVVEGKNLLERPQLDAFRRAMVELQLADGRAANPTRRAMRRPWCPTRSRTAPPTIRC